MQLRDAYRGILESIEIADNQLKKELLEKYANLV